MMLAIGIVMRLFCTWEFWRRAGHLKLLYIYIYQLELLINLNQTWALSLEPQEFAQFSCHGSNHLGPPLAKSSRVGMDPDLNSGPWLSGLWDSIMGTDDVSCHQDCLLISALWALSPLNRVKFSLNSTYATVSCTFPNLFLKFSLGMSKNKCSLRVLPSVIKYLSILHIQQPIHNFLRREGMSTNF